MINRAFARYGWGVLLANMVVIVWGAFVRATGSGAGCGNHWPTCNGELLPSAPTMGTLIEFSHRASSGIALLGVLGLVIWAWRLRPITVRLRWSAVASLVFILLEAAIGAGIVLFEYVAGNASIARAYWMAGHLVNTFFLLAALTLTAWWAGGGAPLRLRGQGLLGWSLGLALVGMLVQGASGGITALGDTLLLNAGITPAQSTVVAWLINVRIFHPVLAFGVAGLIGLAVWVTRVQREQVGLKQLGDWLVAAVVMQLLLGALNVVLQAPVWIQLTHLLGSDVIWILLVLLAARALATPLVTESVSRFEMLAAAASEQRV